MVNSNSVKIIGTSEIEGGLNIDETYTLTIQGDVVTIQKNTNDDGTYDFIYKIKQKTAKITSSDGRQVIVKDTKSQSTRLRAQMMILAEQEGKNPQVEYDFYMLLLRHHWIIVREYLDSLQKKENNI